MNGWAINYRPSQITLRLFSTPPRAPCPLCGRPSRRIHSRYQRTVADLPGATCQVRFEVRVRKFFCENQACERRIFTERLPDVARPWARLTLRLAESLLAVGVALGGRAGSRLTQRLQRPTPPTSWLQVVQNAPMPPPPELHAVGVDEWSWRRGHRYGTMFVNLETHRVIDLLPDRSSESVAQGLAQHPGISAVSRDRSDLYANGITQGAPGAVQVVARFHLVANLREALEACFLAHPTALKQAAAKTAKAISQSVEAPPLTEMYRGRHDQPQNWLKRQEFQRQKRHVARVARYHTICQLYHEGMTVAAIARRLNINRKTVDAQLQRGRPPEPKTRTVRPSDRVLTPYIPYLIERWREGNVSGQQL